jgi:uncharacterized protein YcnI
MMIRSLGAAALLAALAGPALAHVAADPGQAPAGAYQKVAFRIGHGCGKTATTALRLEIPAGVASARPQPKPGWTLEIEKPQGEDRITAVTWRGALPADQFDDFALLVKLPAEAATLYFPAVQTCGEEEEQWTEVPDAEDDPATLKHPAPALRVLPAAAGDMSHHH